MSRNLLQDMVKVKSSSPTLAKTKRVIKEQPPEWVLPEIKKNDKKSKYRLYFTAFVSVVFLLFALSYLFSAAKVTIVPKVKETPLNENLSAVKDSNSSGLPFDLVVISGEENKTIQGGEEKDVAVAARGVVLIYNSFSSSSQALDIDTRLEGSNGKMYKTTRKIVVPGVTSAGKPGSVEVEIYASGTGAEYNSSPLDFKIFGFKGTPKYSKFYARSKGDITGGFIGKSPQVSELDKVTAVNDLKVTLETKLLKKVTDQIPSGFILFKDGAFVDFDEKNVIFTPKDAGSMMVSGKGTLYGFLFDETKLAKKIAEDSVENYDGSEIYIPNIRELNFSLLNKESIIFSEVKNISFTLSGTPKIIWKVNEEKFAADLLSKKKNDFNQILSQYPNIDSAILVIRPFWKTSFPAKSKDIQIIVNYPQ